MVLLLVLLWRALRGARARSSASTYDIRGDMFARSAPISDEQIVMLQYLQAAFSEEGVLFRPRLSHFLTPRKSRQRQAAMLRLAEEQVDFLICRQDGKPLFAFDIDIAKAANDKLLKRDMADKNRILKTAGIRLVRLKGAPANWPAPQVLRLRMMDMVPAAAQGHPSGFDAASGFGTSGFAPSGYTNSGFATAGAPSNPMGLSTIMGLPNEDGTPWGGVRKRS